MPWHDRNLLFTKGGTHEAQEAIAVCSQCLVANECLEYGLAHDPQELSHRFGISGRCDAPATACDCESTRKRRSPMTGTQELIIEVPDNEWLTENKDTNRYAKARARKAPDSAATCTRDPRSSRP